MIAAEGERCHKQILAAVLRGNVAERCIHALPLVRIAASPETHAKGVIQGERSQGLMDVCVQCIYMLFYLEPYSEVDMTGVKRELFSLSVAANPSRKRAYGAL